MAGAQVAAVNYRLWVFSATSSSQWSRGFFVKISRPWTDNKNDDDGSLRISCYISDWIILILLYIVLIWLLLQTAVKISGLYRNFFFIIITACSWIKTYRRIQMILECYILCDKKFSMNSVQIEKFLETIIIRTFSILYLNGNMFCNKKLLGFILAVLVIIVLLLVTLI